MIIDFVMAGRQLFYKGFGLRKIVFCIGSLSAGGAERQIIYIASLLAEKGYDVQLVVLKTGVAYEELAFGGLKVIRLSSTSFLRSCVNLRNHLSENGCDILVSFLPYAIFVSRSVSLLKKTPLISVYRNEKSTSFFKELIIRGTCFIDAITASNVLAAKKNLYCSAIGNGFEVVDNVYLGGYAEKTISPEGNGFYMWGYIGRLEKQKNLVSLIQAFLTHKEKYSNSRLNLVGVGGEEVNLKEYCIRLGLENSVLFSGFKKEVGEEYLNLDAFIMASTREGTPNSLMEAMAASLPVVATPVGAIPEMIEDGVSGILSKDTSVEALVYAMDRLRSLSSEDARCMGEKAQSYIRYRYSSERVTQQWIDIIDKALE